MTFEYTYHTRYSCGGLRVHAYIDCKAASGFVIAEDSGTAIELLDLLNMVYGTNRAKAMLAKKMISDHYDTYRAISLNFIDSDRDHYDISVIIHNHTFTKNSDSSET